MYPEKLDGIYFNDIYIHEPGALISNAAIFALSFALFMYLGKLHSRFCSDWKNFILLIGVGALGGIFTHGFPTYLGENGMYLLWGIKNSSVVFANFFAAMAVIRRCENFNLFRRLLLIKAILVSSALFYFYNFLPAVLDLAFTYIFVIYMLSASVSIDRASRILRGAFILALLSGFLYLVKYDVDRLWFTHKDMVHVFVLLSLLLIYRALVVSARGSRN